jgi:Protein of unknown function (DUF4236)
MGLRFNRRFGIIPGVRLNLGKRGASVSVGVRGAHMTFGTNGTRATVGIPGTGLYWTEKLDAKRPDPSLPPPSPMTPPSPDRLRIIAWAVGGFILLCFLISLAGH